MTSIKREESDDDFAEDFFARSRKIIENDDILHRPIGQHHLAADSDGNLRNQNIVNGYRGNTAYIFGSLLIISLILTLVLGKS